MVDRRTDGESCSSWRAHQARLKDLLGTHDTEDSVQYTLINGYLKRTDVINLSPATTKLIEVLPFQLYWTTHSYLELSNLGTHSIIE